MHVSRHKAVSVLNNVSRECRITNSIHVIQQHRPHRQRASTWYRSMHRHRRISGSQICNRCRPLSLHSSNVLAQIFSNPKIYVRDSSFMSGEDSDSLMSKTRATTSTKEDAMISDLGNWMQHRGSIAHLAMMGNIPSMCICVCICIRGRLTPQKDLFGNCAYAKNC